MKPEESAERLKFIEEKTDKILDEMNITAKNFLNDKEEMNLNIKNKLLIMEDEYDSKI